MIHSNARNILLVDDEPLFVSSVADALRQRFTDHGVVTAGDGAEALQKLSEQTFDLLITDLEMPRLDGFQLLLAMNNRGVSCPAIVISAHNTPELDGRLRGEGALECLEKPVDLSRLLDSIEQVLARGTRARVSGLTLLGFVQLLQMERKTGTLAISAGRGHGALVFRDGQLVDAVTGALTGDEAALELLALTDAQLDFHGHAGQQQSVEQPLSHLMMEAVRLSDEEARRGHADEAPTITEWPPALESVPSDLGDWLLPEGSTRSTSNVPDSLDTAMDIPGAIAVALVDFDSGLTLGTQSRSADFPIEVAAAGNTEVVRAKMRVMKDLGLANELIEDILITLGQQYHIIRPLETLPSLFLYMALRRDIGNLGLARHRLATIEKHLRV